MTRQHETIHAYAAAINALDAEAFANCFAEKCELNDPVGAPPAHGREGAKAFFHAFAPLLSRMNIRAGRIFLNGDKAAFSWAMEAEGRGGQFASAEGIDVFEFDANGKIARSHGYWNPGPFVAALTA